MIWWRSYTLDELNDLAKDNMVGHLAIEFTDIGDDYLCARMPVDDRTRQPAGLLHGGASAALAESLGSIAANMCVDSSLRHCVGLEISANHVRGVRAGYVYGVTRPLHLGGTTQLWEIKIFDAADRLVCSSKLTMAVLRGRSSIFVPPAH